MAGKGNRMRIKLFTFRYSGTLGGFDDRPLAHFVGDKEVLAFREHFFCVNEVPHLLCVVTWQEALVTAADTVLPSEPSRVEDPQHQPIIPQHSGERSKRKGGRAPDPTAGLDETQRLLFNTLREWRLTRAKQDGVPPYLIFTNKNLVALVTKRPESPNALLHLHGIGPGKVKRYGKHVLGLLAGDLAGAGDTGEPVEQSPAETEEARI